MHILSSFDHSIQLELALTALEQAGIERDQIVAISLRTRQQPGQVFDSIHRSDGISLMDTGMICATILTVIGSSYGFVLPPGPILSGIAGAVIGFLIGFAIDLATGRAKRRRLSGGRRSEVIVLVQCGKDQAERIESILWTHAAFGVASIDA